MNNREINFEEIKDYEGFPNGTEKDILSLSDIPYYTACPNPFLPEFVEENGSKYNESEDDYNKEPFSSDVTEGKTGDPIYNAHSYHTKVPHKAIMRYILHYTNPGDIVLDGFCGSGMTGVAAQMCQTPDRAHKALIDSEMKDVQWGSRKAILSDLSPIATFLAANYNMPLSAQKYEVAAKQVIKACEEECAWMEETIHSDNSVSSFVPQMGRINYTIWSDVYICPHCGKEITQWKIATNKREDNKPEHCYYCNAELSGHLERALTTYFDEYLNEPCTIAKEVPVRINYTYGRRKYEKDLDDHDYEVLEKINNQRIPYWFPTDRMCEGGEARRNDDAGLKYVHQFYTKRNLYILSKWYDECQKYEDVTLRNRLLMAFTGVVLGESKLNRFLFKETSFPFYLLSGTLYVGGLRQENNPLKDLNNKALLRIAKIAHEGWKNNVIVSTGSSTTLSIPDDSVDYVFVDPPFGANLDYSELSFIWEAWIKVITNNKQEAIINKSQQKGLLEYQDLMMKCFAEFFRVLKPGRWMTVEFHNSKNAVWNAIQEALSRTGFVIADVRTLDKQQQSFKQINSNGAVKQDLVISAYKPKQEFRNEIIEKAGSPETAWSFVRQHLQHLSTVVINNGKIEISAERQAYLLFDRMVAYHIMQGLPIPIDAVDFYQGLDDRFLKRDGMYFLPDQVNEYDMARIKNEVEDVQLSFLVTNEKSAISWLYYQLAEPQTYAQLQPKFMQEVKSIDKYEEIPELAVLLEENFLQDEKGHWYIPDVTKEGDVAKLREKKLWKEFEGYLATKGKLKLFRSEAIRAGFARLWKEKNYKAIVDMAQRLPDQTVQEDSNILMYYDISLSRV